MPRQAKELQGSIDCLRVTPKRRSCLFVGGDGLRSAIPYPFLILCSIRCSGLPLQPSQFCLALLLDIPTEEDRRVSSITWRFGGLVTPQSLGCEKSRDVHKVITTAPRYKIIHADRAIVARTCLGRPRSIPIEAVPWSIEACLYELAGRLSDGSVGWPSLCPTCRDGRAFEAC